MGHLQKRIFVLIDDNEIDLLLHHKIIEIVMPEAEIMKFSSGESALDFFKYSGKNQSYIILLDIRMPVMDGFQFLDAFSELDESITSNCKIYLLSSSTNQFDVSRAHANKFVTSLVTKPFTKDQFIKLINTPD